MASPSLSALLREQARLPFLAGNCMTLDRDRAGWLVAEVEVLEADARTIADFIHSIPRLKQPGVPEIWAVADIPDDVRAAVERRRSREGGR